MRIGWTSLVCIDLKDSFLLRANSHLLPIFICSVQLSFLRLLDNQHRAVPGMQECEL